tara:strand:+ start:557 stop:1186 length:630 start_codon:yes stop_codon:yes gene_type:complete
VKSGISEIINGMLLERNFTLPGNTLIYLDGVKNIPKLNLNKFSIIFNFKKNPNFKKEEFFTNNFLLKRLTLRRNLELLSDLYTFNLDRLIKDLEMQEFFTAFSNTKVIDIENIQLSQIELIIYMKAYKNCLILKNLSEIIKSMSEQQLKYFEKLLSERQVFYFTNNKSFIKFKNMFKYFVIYDKDKNLDVYIDDENLEAFLNNRIKTEA